MRKRPLSIRLLALAFMLSPLGVVIEMIYLYEVKPRYWHAIFHAGELWTPQIWAIIIITPLIGLAIWTTRRWAYYALVAYTVLILVNNIAVWLSGTARSGLVERTVMIVAYIFLVFIEIRKQFYAPYINPRLRWWDQARRYLTDRFHIIVKDSATAATLFQADSFDVSETGIYLKSDHAAAIGETYLMDIMLPGDKIVHAVADVVWVHGGNDQNPAGFGCRFKTLDRRFRHEIRAAVRHLKAAMQR